MKKEPLIKTVKVDRDTLNQIIKAMTIKASTKSEEEMEEERTLLQWEVSPTGYRAIGKTESNLPSGLYKLVADNYANIYFKPQKVTTQDLLRFPDSQIDEVASHIDKFWKSRKKYQEFDVQYKRGIILYGPPGSGKSSIIKLLIKDVVERDGIAISFGNPTLFMEGLAMLREVHPKKPVVCIIEDIESLFMEFNPSVILNILDGSTSSLDNIIFVATTNYPERLEPRVSNRPSRFDRMIKVPYPNEEVRRAYLINLFNNSKKAYAKKINKWVRDTENFSFPHMTELFLGVHLYGKDYEETLDTIKKMGEFVHSSEDMAKAEIGISS